MPNPVDSRLYAASNQARPSPRHRSGQLHRRLCAELPLSVAMPSAEGSREYPKRVRVVYSDGAEEVGTAIDANHVDVSPMGLQVKPKEVVEIDGVPRVVSGFAQPSVPKHVRRMGEEAPVRLRLKNLP